MIGPGKTDRNGVYHENTSHRRDRIFVPDFIHFLIGPENSLGEGCQILNLDKTAYAGNLKKLADFDFVLQEGRAGEVYNIRGNAEKTKLEMTKTMLELLAKPKSVIPDVPDLPGHDRRYAVNLAKNQRNLRGSPSDSLPESLAQNIRWYLSREKWRRRIKNGSCRDFYRKYYQERLP